MSRLVNLVFDDYLLLIEKEHKKQCAKRNEPIPNRSEIVRNLYKEYLEKRTIAKV